MIQQKTDTQTSQFYESLKTIICLVGNDGTGKSTLSKTINQISHQQKLNIFCLQRSFSPCPQQLLPLIGQLKTLDKITYFYSYENQRKNFTPLRQLTITPNDKNKLTKQVIVQVYWVVLDLLPEQIFPRLKSRIQVEIYDSKKSIEYYSYIYRQFAYYFGFALISAKNKPHQIAEQILQNTKSDFYSQIAKTNMKELTLQKIDQLNIQKIIEKSLLLNQEKVNQLSSFIIQTIKKSPISDVYFCNDQLDKSLSDNSKKISLRVKLCSRYLALYGKIIANNFMSSVEYYLQDKNVKYSIPINISQDNPYFKIHQEGQSKILLKIQSLNQKISNYFKDKIVILLKSTIYSHTQQHCGQIPHLGQIRALGNVLFLEMIRRNNLQHAYLSINQAGLIISNLVQTNALQIVFKKECLGTDKHSYQGIQTIPEIVDQSNCYAGGVYIRFDWRNPNHIIKKYPNLVLNLDPYYYVIQKWFGKQTFFKQFLSNQKILAIGDKCITSDCLQNYVPVSRTKENALKLYATFAFYARKVGLQILDGCFMFDKNGEIGWSEINPDCMRVKSIIEREDYDKDIWRYGGSASKDKICQKWTIFNKIFIDWFNQNRFHKTEMIQLPQLCYTYQQTCRQILQKNKNISPQYKSIYRKLILTNPQKRFIATIDISQSKPILVKSSQITQNHSQSIQNAYDYISLLEDIVLVDIDSALDKQNTGKNNRNLIKSIITRDNGKILAVGGGIRNKEVLNFYLNQAKAKKIIISSNLELLDLLSKKDIEERVIVQLSINQSDQILTHGRKVNTHVKIIDKIKQLINKGVLMISITFNCQQGHLKGLPYKQFHSIMARMPNPIKNVIIAGGITSIQDLRYIWGFKKCIPQLGSAIWKKKISISDIFLEIVNYNKQGLIPGLIVDQSNQLIGQVYLNDEALKLSCQQKVLYRYSRKYQKIMKKGDTSGNIFKIVKFKLDCDNDAIKITVRKSQEKEETIFCHQQKYGCFQQKNSHLQHSIHVLQTHIKHQKDKGSGYSKRMMENQGLAMSKLIQEVQELYVSKDNKVSESADIIAHLLMYLNSQNVEINQVMKELSRRAITNVNLQNQQQINVSKQANKEKTIKIGVLYGKHHSKIDEVTEKILGIRILRTQNRDMRVQFQVINEEVFNSYKFQSKIQLISIRSKDMPVMLAKKKISFCINYQIMMKNNPQTGIILKKVQVQNLKLALLSKNDKKINPKEWTHKNKGSVACQYPVSVNDYLKSIGIAENCYTLTKVSGGTQSYVLYDGFDYCDAIVSTGQTIKDNNLKIQAILEDPICAGFYQGL